MLFPMTVMTGYLKKFLFEKRDYSLLRDIMDEILDSSIDIQGLQKIIDIIQVKQREDNSRVFIISHRQEVDELEIDNVYFVTKSDGYSSVKIKEKE